MSQEAGEQQGGQCGCVQIWLMQAFLAGALEGGMLGFQWGERAYGWWGRVLGAAAGSVVGAVAGVLIGMVLVAITGLVACGLMWIEERRKAPGEET